jgi:N,N'-diacetyllegionaminate synthase
MIIGNKKIGERTYVIAEAGVNHNGDLERAKDLIIKAALAGADAIKFQTYKAEDLVVKGTPKFWDAKSKVDEGLNQFEAYKKIDKFPLEWYPELIKCCEENNIEFLSTAFSFEAADYLNSIGMKAFKVASSDLTHLPFLKHIARFGKPILLSTGASTMFEIYEAVETIRKEGNDNIAILHCTLNYPTERQDSNLNLIKTFGGLFHGLPIGISDHTLDIFTPVIAVAKGACIVEKHFTVDKTLPDSADHWLSIDPVELREMVDNIRHVELLGGSYEKKVFPCEEQTRKLDKRSIVSKVNIKKGQKVTEHMLTYKRPGTGIAPKYYKELIGRIAEVDIKEDTTLIWDNFSSNQE